MKACMYGVSFADPVTSVNCREIVAVPCHKALFHWPQRLYKTREREVILGRVGSKEIEREREREPESEKEGDRREGNRAIGWLAVSDWKQARGGVFLVQSMLNKVFQ